MVKKTAIQTSKEFDNFLYSLYKSVVSNFQEQKKTMMDKSNLSKTSAVIRFLKRNSSDRYY